MDLTPRPSSGLFCEAFVPSAPFLRFAACPSLSPFAGRGVC